MNIDSIANLANTVSSLSGSTGTSASTAFTDILSEAINNASATDAADKDSTLALLSGADEELHTTMIESQKAELALNLAIEIRNKVVDAYNEVMRMQV